MTVSFAYGDPSQAAALNAEITLLAARTDTYSQNLLNQRQQELVQVLLAQNNLVAASILSTCSYVTNNPLVAAITALQTLATSYGQTPPGYAANETVDQKQRQLVTELMASGQLPASTILSTMTNTGPSQFGTL